MTAHAREPKVGITFRIRHLAFLAAFALAATTSLTIPTVANADEILTYIGNDFTFPNPSSDNVTAIVDLSSPLANSATTTVTPASFEITGLGVKLTQGNTLSSTFIFTTNSVGRIISWDVIAEYVANDFIITTVNDSRAVVDEVVSPFLAGPFQTFGVANNPSIWKTTTSGTSVPEPSTLCLFGGGLLAFAFSRRQRKQ